MKLYSILNLYLDIRHVVFVNVDTQNNQASFIQKLLLIENKSFWDGKKENNISIKKWFGSK